MIVVDIETSGLSQVKNGICQIGAIDLITLEEFFEESRIDDSDLISKEALIIIGKTEKELRDKNKQSQKKLIENFFNWIKRRKIKILVGHNTSFDKSFLEIKGEKYGFEIPFLHRSFDLHTIAQIKFYELNNVFSIKENSSKMSLSKVLDFCGIVDKRIHFEKGKKITDGSFHNALEDAKLTAECFSRLIYGKNFIPKFSKFRIPNYLK